MISKIKDGSNSKYHDAYFSLFLMSISIKSLVSSRCSKGSWITSFHTFPVNNIAKIKGSRLCGLPVNGEVISLEKTSTIPISGLWFLQFRIFSTIEITILIFHSYEYLLVKIHSHEHYLLDVFCINSSSSFKLSLYLRVSFFHSYQSRFSKNCISRNKDYCSDLLAFRRPF